MNNDLTILFLTLNNLPKGWEEYQKQILLDSIGDAELITISKIPMDMGKGINLIQDEEPSANNIYRQMLRASKIATTKYIAIAESDTLYCKDHWGHRPADDEFAFNLSHWSLFTWGTPIYGWRNRKGNYSMIAPRELVIEALEERFAKYPSGTPPELTGELGRWKLDSYLGLKQRKQVDFYTNNPIINVNHELGLDDRAKRHQKTIGTLRSYDIPMWGKASELVKKFA
jgi:hypothetical protein